jgi:predicted HTH transcriptional regulator
VTHYIKKLIEEGEHQRLDFKFEISDSRKIARTLVAFANTDGGTLLIGVKDNGNIAGVRSEEEIYMVEAAASMYCKPKVETHFKKWTVEGKAVLEVLVPKSTQCPHYADVGSGKWMVFIRVNDENILANSIHLKVWKQKMGTKGVFIEFTEKEKILLKHLQTNETISLSKFCKIALLTRKTAENMLANLISLGIIEMVYTNQHFEYRRKNKKNPGTVAAFGAYVV